MTISLANLKTVKKRKSRRLGRGNSSGRGTYSGRGLKGQRSRSGGRKGLQKLAAKAFLKNLPKSRGFKSFYPKNIVVNLDTLEKIFKDNETVDPERLLKEGIIRSAYPAVKILGQGKISKKLIVKAHGFSRVAENAIKKAGGEAIKLKMIPKKA